MTSRHVTSAPARQPRRAAPMALAALLTLAACAVTTPPAPDAPHSPAAWLMADAGPNARLDAPWWQPLGDATLSALIDDALARNRDVARAAVRLQQAEAQARRSAQDRWPTVTGGASAGVQRPLQRSGPDAVVINGVSVPLPDASGTSTNSGTSLTATWELDLWGRVAASIAAAEQAVRISEVDRETARWLITTQVAEQYWRIAMADRKLPLAAAASTDAAASLKATALQFEVGKLKALDVARAEAALAEARQREAQLATQRRAALFALALLLDRPVAAMEVPEARLPASEPDAFNAGPPAAVLDRRPDLRSARLALDAALLKARITEASRYPPVQLSASLGAGGASLGQWLANPVAGLGLALSLPMLDAARQRADQDLAALQVKDAAIAFRDGVAKALADVEAQFNQRRQLDQDRAVALDKQRTARAALEVARRRHAAGADALQKVREAEQALRDADAALVELQLSRWLNLVAIHKALGGPV